MPAGTASASISSRNTWPTPVRASSMPSAFSAKAALAAPKSFSMEPAEFSLLRTFRGLFEGKCYEHRNSTLGDSVANQLYEDLVVLNKSPALVCRVQAHECVVNLANKTVGKPGRRGDGTFGELVPT